MNRDVQKTALRFARNYNKALFYKAVTSNFVEHFCTPSIKKTRHKGLIKTISNSTIFTFLKTLLFSDEALPETNIISSIYAFSDYASTNYEALEKPEYYELNFIRCIIITKDFPYIEKIN